MIQQKERLLDEALALYGFRGAAVRFIRHNENITYSVEDASGQYLLRIHRPVDGLDFSLYHGGYEKKALISSEMALLNWLHLTGELTVQRPRANKAGEWVSRLEGGELLTVLSWIDGETLSGATPDRPTAFRIGQMIAKLHRATEAIPPLTRCRYDEAFLETIGCEMRRAREAGHLGAAVCRQIEAILARLGQRLIGAGDRFAIVHADLSKSNLINTRRAIAPIDFSMCGYGLPEMDLGDLAYTFGGDGLTPDLLAGYRSVRGAPIDEGAIGLWRAFSAIAYIAIHHHRAHMQDRDRFRQSLERWRKGLFEPLLVR